MGNSNEGLGIGKNYVGGVIGKNEVAITGTSEQSVGIINSGTVIALAGGAGGIIGENSADITHVIMKNEGEVHGNASIEGSTEENGTGGIIGIQLQCGAVFEPIGDGFIHIGIEIAIHRGYEFAALAAVFACCCASFIRFHIRMQAFYDLDVVDRLALKCSSVHR